MTPRMEMILAILPVGRKAAIPAQDIAHQLILSTSGVSSPLAALHRLGLALVVNKELVIKGTVARRVVPHGGFKETAPRAKHWYKS